MNEMRVASELLKLAREISALNDAGFLLGQIESTAMDLVKLAREAKETHAEYFQQHTMSLRSILQDVARAERYVERGIRDGRDWLQPDTSM